MRKAIVVGSGAGGRAAAAELAKSFEVTVLEEGGAFSPFSWNLARMEPLRQAGLFLDERLIQIIFPSMRILKARPAARRTGGAEARGEAGASGACAIPEGLVHVHGRCLGGTTQLATGNAVRADEHLEALGIHLDAEFEELSARVPVTTDHRRTWSPRTEQLWRIFERQGLQPFVTPKLLAHPQRCAGCGHCVLGCPTGAKWNATRLLDGCKHLTVRPRCRAEHLVMDGSQAAGVRVTEKGRGAHTLYADVVVLAAGGLGTPLVLQRSGLQTSPTLFVDPVLCVAAAWENAHLDRQLPMPFVSQREGYILSPYFDWLSFFFNRDWRTRSQETASIMIKLADDNGGSYDGRTLRKTLTERDRARLVRAVYEAQAVLEEAGIPRSNMFLGTLNAGHPGATLPLTQAEARTLHPRILPPNVYVADASLMPHALGLPPILTVMALAKRVAKTAAI